MADQSSRLGFPLLASGQAQKELYHNEALVMADMLVQGCVQDGGVNTPPLSPVAGQCWITGPAPTGAWAGHADAVAGWTDGGWRFAPARAGMSFWHAAAGAFICHDGTAWDVGNVRANKVSIGGYQVVGPQQPTIADVSGGSVIDLQARAVLAAVLAALRGHGLIAT